MWMTMRLFCEITRDGEWKGWHAWMRETLDILPKSAEYIFFFSFLA